jgi:hypothetical protein
MDDDAFFNRALGCVIGHCRCGGEQDEKNGGGLEDWHGYSFHAYPV